MSTDAEYRAVHAPKRLQVPACIKHGDGYGNADLAGLVFGSIDDRLRLAGIKLHGGLFRLQMYVRTDRVGTPNAAVFRPAHLLDSRCGRRLAGPAFLHGSIVILPNLNAGSGDRPH